MPPIVGTLVGSGVRGLIDGPAGASQMNFPRDVAVGLDGTVYIADKENHVMRSFSNGVLRTFSGSDEGRAGYTDGPPALARYNQVPPNIYIYIYIYTYYFSNVNITRH